MKILLCIILFFVFSCQKTDYLYYAGPVYPGPTHTIKHVIKDITLPQTIDILWVIDDSGSMDAYQTAVSNNMGLFMQEFTKKKLDWKMGLISTDYYRQPIIGLDPIYPFTFLDPLPISTFQNAINKLGTSGSGTETISYPIYNKLNSYPNFVRSKSIFAIIIVTDAEDQSNNMGHNFTKTMSYLKTLKPDPKDLVIYGAFGATDLNCPATDSYWTYKGSDYEQVITATNGKYFSLCSSTFGKDLAGISKDLVSKIESPRIYLKQRPKTQSIKILYKSQELAPGLKENNGYWLYNFEANAVIFHDLEFAKNDLEEVEVIYEEAI